MIQLKFIESRPFLKYATILPEDEAILSFREAIIHTLKRRGV